jgi:hypothetical protein
VSVARLIPADRFHASGENGQCVYDGGYEARCVCRKGYAGEKCEVTFVLLAVVFVVADLPMKHRPNVKRCVEHRARSVAIASKKRSVDFKNVEE